jgi:cold shock CspA family protein
MATVQGHVREFLRTKHYGWVISDTDAASVWFHEMDFQGDPTTLKKGLRVCYTILSYSKKGRLWTKAVQIGALPELAVKQPDPMPRMLARCAKRPLPALGGDFTKRLVNVEQV